MQKNRSYVVDLSRKVEWCVPSKRSTLAVLRGTLTSVLLIVLSLGSFADLLFFSPLAQPKRAEAAYSGKTLRTVEYVLGGGAGTGQFKTGTDNNASARASDTNLYAGSSWNTTKSSAGTKTIKINGTSIRVVSAYVDTTALITTSVNVTDVEIALDVSPGMRPGVDVELTPVARNGTANIYAGMTGEALAFKTRTDATALFQNQTDANWASGLSVVGMLSITGPAWTNATMKLIITYEEDYTTVAHNATKTVRFPLRSTGAATDDGTRQSACTSGSTCAFTSYAHTVDLATTSDIYDVWYEVEYVDVDSTTAGSSTIKIGSANEASIPHIETITDVGMFLIYRPLVGSTGFLATTTQTLNVLSGNTSKNGVTAELVVTYKYSTGAATQIDTVQYIMGQETAPVGTASTTWSRQISIANPGAAVQNLWFKSYAALSAANTWHVQGKIGSSASTTASVVAGGAVRGGEATIITDMGAATSSFSSATTTVWFYSSESSATADAPQGTEVYVTFTWNGSAGPQTKTNRFFAGTSGAVPVLANGIQSFSYAVELPETVTKTYRSAYVKEAATHGNSGTTITIGTRTILPVASSSVTIGDNGGDTEAFTATYLAEATTTDGWTASSTFSWTKRLFLHTASLSVGNTYAVSGEMVVTYEANFNETGTTQNEKSLRTVEFVLGSNGSLGGSYNTGTDGKSQDRASNADVYAGSSWNTTKTGAGLKTIALQGSGIRVVSSYVQFTAIPTVAADVTDLELTLDVRPGLLPTVDVELSPIVSNGATLLFSDSSGNGGLITYVVDATSLFQTQTDAEWNAGLSVVGMASVSGPNWNFATMKLVVTYEQDYSSSAHNETKTVRFPLRSTQAGDSGTRSTSCPNLWPTPSICSLSYFAFLPDLATSSDIADVWFELSFLDTAAGVATTSISGSATSTEHDALEFIATADTNLRKIVYRPMVGTPNFMATTSQALDVSVRSSDLELLGGEVVVTYKFSTGAPTQIETVSFPMGQGTVMPGTATTSFSRDVTISNNGFVPRDVWYRIRSPISAAVNLLADGKIGTSASTTVRYQPSTFAGARSGEAFIIHDLGSATTSWTTPGTTLRLDTAFSSATGDAPVNAEAIVTFSWNASSGGTQTKTVKFFAGASGSVPATASTTQAFSYLVEFPESVTKTFRSAYVLESLWHTDATAIDTAYVIVLPVASSSYLFREADTGTLGFAYTLLAEATTSDGFSSGATLGWAKRSFLNIVQLGVAEEMAASGEMLVTYDAAFAAIGGGTASLNQLHYRWRNDDGSQSAATFAAGEDATSTSNWFLGDRMRLRFLISNDGDGATTSIAYRPEYAQSPCASGWTTVPTAVALGSEHWVMDQSQYVLDASASTNVASGLTDPGGGSFVAGEARTVSNTTGGHALSTNQFTEHEFSLRSTINLSTGTVYCFRLTNSGSTYGFVYTVRPDISISGGSRPVTGGGNIESMGSGSMHGGGGQGGGSGAGGEGGGSGGSHGGGGQGGGGGDSG